MSTAHRALIRAIKNFFPYQFAITWVCNAFYVCVCGTENSYKTVSLLSHELIFAPSCIYFPFGVRVFLYKIIGDMRTVEQQHQPPHTHWLWFLLTSLCVLIKFKLPFFHIHLFGALFSSIFFRMVHVGWLLEVNAFCVSLGASSMFAHSWIEAIYIIKRNNFSK